MKAPTGRKKVKIKDEEVEYHGDIARCFGSKQEVALYKVKGGASSSHTII
jgi:hypothetical protein